MQRRRWMTDNEIMLEATENVKNGLDVGYTVGGLLGIIRQQQEMIESLISGQETLQKYIVEKDAEISRLEYDIELLKQEKRIVQAKIEEIDIDNFVKEMGVDVDA